MSDEIMLTEHLEKPALPPAWDYDTSVDKAKISINKWKNVTIEFLCELWIAREKLSVSWEEKQRTSSGTFVPLDKTWDSYCDDIGIEKRTANRWLQRTFELSNNIHISDDSYEWYTPPEYISAAYGVLGGIDLDPASNAKANEIIKASEYYTKEQDGLIQQWHGKVWLNPPYNMPLIEQFTNKAIDEYEMGNIEAAIILVNNATDTNWFHNLINYPVCLTKGRVQFWTGEGPNLGARQGQAIFYLGNNPDLFAQIFNIFGVVLKKYDN